jgi:hypothetical protein
MYEALYSYSRFVVWIAFKRVEHEVIMSEINRLLRTDTFNPMLHSKSVSSAADDESESMSDERLTEADYRRKHSGRPPLKSIITQRSATLVSILPLPKEEASWLFNRHTANSSIPPGTSTELTEEEVGHALQQSTVVDKTQLKFGIIGEPLNRFDPVTLTSLSQEELEKIEKANTHSRHDLPSIEGQKSSLGAEGGKSSSVALHENTTGIKENSTGSITSGEDVSALGTDAT